MKDSWMCIFIHIANLVYMYAYTVKEIRKQRIITIIGILCCIPYYYALVRYEAITWSVVFLGINAWRLKTLPPIPG